MVGESDVYLSWMGSVGFFCIYYTYLLTGLFWVKWRALYFPLNSMLSVCILEELDWVPYGSIAFYAPHSVAVQFSHRLPYYI